MKDRRQRHVVELAICLAVMMHLWLFLAVRPANGGGLSGVPVPPATHYLAASAGPAPEPGNDVRTIWSPVVFSLPSKMGFSRELLEEKIHSRLTFRQPDNTEIFLAVVPGPRDSGPLVVPEELMLTAGRRPAPRPPFGQRIAGDARAAPRRVYMTPELAERLVGGIVLPPPLNQAGNTAWEVRADVGIAQDGAVRHVFLEQPMESAALNQEVINLLNGLQFRSGQGPVAGRIEIYSPAALPGGGAKP